MKKIPVHIVSGFLGSGKTTFLCDLLKQKKDHERWAVIINEFGKVSIDSTTIRTFSKLGEEIFELAGGCICCSASHLFKDNLTKIANSGNFGRIIIEPSGLGGIEMISELIRELPELVQMPVLCLVDIFSVEQARLQMNFMYKAQILQADVVLFSHCDQIEEKSRREELLAAFGKYFPDKEYYLKTEISPDDFIAKFSFSANHKHTNVAVIYSSGLKKHTAGYTEKTFIFDSEICFSTDRLGKLLAKYPSVLRAKGHIRDRHGWNIINFTKSGFESKRCSEKKQNEFIVILESAKTELIQEIETEIRGSII